MADVFLRAATAEDQAAIWGIIVAARLNFMSLDWRHFVVAESGGEVVGAGQVKVLSDGARELASLAVRSAHQGAGVGGALVWTLISCTPGPIYLRCASHNERFYHRFGFVTLPLDQMPRPLRRTYCITNHVVGLYERFIGDSERLLIMGRL